MQKALDDVEDFYQRRQMSMFHLSLITRRDAILPTCNQGEMKHRHLPSLIKVFHVIQGFLHRTHLLLFLLARKAHLHQNQDLPRRLPQEQQPTLNIKYVTRRSHQAQEGVH
jgi:hypothetical protein